MDREKVIKGLEELSGFLFKEYGKAQAEEANLYYDRFLAVDNALALLKEQEAKIPSIMQDVEGIWSTCPTCGNKLRAILAMEMDTYFPKYCQVCGQAVKWE